MAREYKLDRVEFSMTLEAELVRKLVHMQEDLDTKSRNETIEVLLKRATERVQLDDEDVEWIEAIIARNRQRRNEARQKRNE